MESPTVELSETEAEILAASEGDESLERLWEYSDQPVFVLADPEFLEGFFQF